MKDEHSIAVVIPALNEERAIGRVLTNMPAWVDTVVVADNGSNDKTAEIARRCGAKVVYEPRRGYGAACLRGLGAVGNPDIVVFMDADNSDDPSEMAALVGPIVGGEADFVIGSRALGTAESGSLTWPQRFGNVLASTLMRRIWGQRCTDLGPFRAIRFGALLELDMDDLDFGWTVQMQARAFQRGLRVVEVPVRYRKRIGRSKISGTVRGVVCAGTKILTTIAREAIAGRKAAPARRALLVFTRYPEPGKVKTRLIPALGAQGAAELQREMTIRTLSAARDWLQRAGSALTVLFDGGDAEAMSAMFGDDMQYRPQGEGSLGERLYSAFELMRHSGTHDIVAIGSDCPSIDAAQLDVAFDRLRRYDVVVGPATDGGYYLIGMSTPRSELFSGISWGTEHVLAETLDICRKRGLNVALLDERRDIDTPGDLPYWYEISCSMAAETSNAPYLSVIIPTLNEERHISATLETVGSSRDVEIIVADGGSIDQTRAIAATLGARVISTPTGRATQMNAGAAVARGEVLLFLHADTRAPFGYVHRIRNSLEDPQTSAGAFRLALDDTRLTLRLIELAAGLRSKWIGLPFGDQGIFMRRTTFRDCGGFRDLPIMEDYDLVTRIKAHGRVKTVHASAITSARRWLTQGTLHTWLTHMRIVAGWYLGVSPNRLAAWRNSGGGPNNGRPASYQDEPLAK